MNIAKSILNKLLVHDKNTESISNADFLYNAFRILFYYKDRFQTSHNKHDVTILEQTIEIDVLNECSYPSIISTLPIAKTMISELKDFAKNQSKFSSLNWSDIKSIHLEFIFDIWGEHFIYAKCVVDHNNLITAGTVVFSTGKKEFDPFEFPKSQNKLSFKNLWSFLRPKEKTSTFTNDINHSTNLPPVAPDYHFKTIDNIQLQGIQDKLNELLKFIHPYLEKIENNYDDATLAENNYDDATLAENKKAIKRISRYLDNMHKNERPALIQIISFLENCESASKTGGWWENVYLNVVPRIESLCYQLKKPHVLYVSSSEKLPVSYCDKMHFDDYIEYLSKKHKIQKETSKSLLTELTNIDLNNSQNVYETINNKASYLSSCELSNGRCPISLFFLYGSQEVDQKYRAGFLGMAKHYCYFRISHATAGGEASAYHDDYQGLLEAIVSYEKKKTT
jgi:hypothetical protein